MARSEDDRAAILARRAAFVASTLAQVGVSLSAYADEGGGEEPPCAETPTPSPESLAEARQRFEIAAELHNQGRFEEAAVELRRVLLLAYNEKVVARAMSADMARGAPGDAWELGHQHLRCVGPSEPIETLMRQVETETGVITVRLEDPRDVILDIDGASVDVRRAARGIRVLPGSHKVRAASNGQERRNEIQVVAGETVSVSIAPFPPPMPCLSPHPCLEPPLRNEHKDTLLRLQAGAMVPAVAVLPDDTPNVLIGTGASLSLAVQIADHLWFDGDLFEMTTITRARALVYGGSNVELKYFPIDAYGFGAGFSGGVYGFPSGNDSRRLENISGMFGPVIVPASIMVDRLYFEARVPFWFSPIEERSETTFGLGAVAPHVVVGISIPLLDKTEPVQSASSRGRGAR
ncbi:MAG: hypothetical protein HOV80_20530 [Polyangiaceae bacterium]|nr:hypothetical protein [Polyangiaceae bacterium]